MLSALYLSISINLFPSLCLLSSRALSFVTTCIISPLSLFLSFSLSPSLFLSLYLSLSLFLLFYLPLYHSLSLILSPYLSLSFLSTGYNLCFLEILDFLLQLGELHLSSKYFFSIWKNFYLQRNCFWQLYPFKEVKL